MKVSVIIPTCNGKRFLGPCLEALKLSALPAGSSLEAIVVDNGTNNDGSAEVLARHPWVKVLSFERQLGFSKANNAARATASGDVVAFLNNDTCVDVDWLRRPLELLQNDARVSAVGSKLLFMHRFVPIRIGLEPQIRVLVASSIFGNELDGKVGCSAAASREVQVGNVTGRWLQDGSVIHVPVPIEGIDPPTAGTPTLRVLASSGPFDRLEMRIGEMPRFLYKMPAVLPLAGLERLPSVRLIQNAGTFVSELGEAGDVGAGQPQENYATEEVVPSLCGAGLIVRRTELDAVGWFPEYYFAYFEDVDLCLRLRARGGQLVFCPSSIVNHYHTGTNRERSAGFIRHVARSSLLFLSRYGTAASIRYSVKQRFQYVRNELHEFSLASWSHQWGHAHSTRGILQALPALSGVVAERFWDQARSPSSLSLLLRPFRLPYQEQQPPQID